MVTSRRAVVAILAVLAVTLLLTAGPVLGEPHMQTNLVRNGGFEENSTAGWQTFAAIGEGSGCVDDRPDYVVTDASNRVHSGSRAASYYIGWRTFQAGFYQQVTVTQGARYRFSAWGHMWITDNPSVTTSGYPAAMRVGIDPTGGTSASASSVQWSGEVDARDTYREMSVEAQAQGTTITVFMYARATFCVEKSDAYWDDASLVEIAAASSGGTPQAGQAPAPTATTSSGTWGTGLGSIPVATPRADGSVVHVVGQGETLIGIAVTYDVSLEELIQLNNLANPRVIYVGQEIIVRPAGSVQPSEPAEPPPAEETGGEGEGEEAPEEGEEGGETADTTQPSEPAVPEAAEGTICVLAYEDVNGDGLRDPAAEQLAAGVTFTITDGAQQIVANFVTDGFTEQSCYNLMPGTYIVRWASDTHQATTDQMWTAGVTGGGLASREFGVQTTGEEAEAGGGGGGRGLTTALIAAGGVVLLLIGIGAAVYFFVLRRPASDF